MLRRVPEHPFVNQVLAGTTQRETLTEARTVLVAYLQLEGIKLPQKRGRKPGWRKAQEAVAVAG